MIIEIERQSKITKCDQDDCNNVAVAVVTYKNIFKHRFCLCKDCLNKVYKNIGKLVTPKSPQNIIVKKMKEKKYE